MVKKILFVLLLQIVCAIPVFAELRAFNDIFPNMDSGIRTAVFSASGYVKSSEKKSGLKIIGEPELTNAVMSKNPGFIVESISVIPAEPGTIKLLDVYNALGNIRGLKGRLYSSFTRKQEIPLFEDATRLVSERQLTAISDPAPASAVPRTETVFIKLKDVNFGNSYYRGEMALTENGLRYSMVNFKSLTYLLIPVIKEGKFISQLYFEPIKEGILIYSIAGADVSDFFSSKIDMDSAIAKRLAVIVSWASDGIVKK
jgi:hypothetical protein